MFDACSCGVPEVVSVYPFRGPLTTCCHSYLISWKPAHGGLTGGRVTVAPEPLRYSPPVIKSWAWLHWSGASLWLLYSKLFTLFSFCCRKKHWDAYSHTQSPSLSAYLCLPLSSILSSVHWSIKHDWSLFGYSLGGRAGGGGGYESDSTFFCARSSFQGGLLENLMVLNIVISSSGSWSLGLWYSLITKSILHSFFPFHISN